MWHMDSQSDVLKIFLNNKKKENLQRPYRAMDIANYIVDNFAKDKRPITNILLLKMLYYLQAFFLVKDGNRLFTGDIEKWGYGPVEPIVYSYFKDNGASPIISSVSYVINNDGNLETISPDGRNLDVKDEKVIDSVINKLYDKYHDDPFKLVDLTHNEPMWKQDKDRIENGVHNIKYNNQEIIKYFGSGDKWPWQ